MLAVGNGLVRQSRPIGSVRARTRFFGKCIMQSAHTDGSSRRGDPHGAGLRPSRKSWRISSARARREVRSASAVTSTRRGARAPSGRCTKGLSPAAQPWKLVSDHLERVPVPGRGHERVSAGVLQQLPLAPMIVHLNDDTGCPARRSPSGSPRNQPARIGISRSHEHW